MAHNIRTMHLCTTQVGSSWIVSYRFVRFMHADTIEWDRHQWGGGTYGENLLRICVPSLLWDMPNPPVRSYRYGRW